MEISTKYSTNSSLGMSERIIYFEGFFRLAHVANNKANTYTMYYYVPYITESEHTMLKKKIRIS